MITVIQQCGEGINWIREAEYNFVVNGKKISNSTGSVIYPSKHSHDKVILKNFGESNAYTTND